MNDHQERIDRLEEAHAFADRTCEQLSEQLIRAFDRIDRLEKRLARLDQKFEDFTESLTSEERTLEDDVPPHSGKR